MKRFRLLDLFCGAGGCSVGYHRAGFDVVGVDSWPQPRYPFEFHCDEALWFLEHHGHEFDAIHASPPCQAYTVGQHIHRSGNRHQDLVCKTRDLLENLGSPWVMENVVGSPLKPTVVLCGLTFGLKVLRHRLFEASFPIDQPEHVTHPTHLRTGTRTVKRGGKGNGYSTGKDGLICVAGNNFVRTAGARAMGIDWVMTRKELANAIPPAYTEYTGRFLMRHLNGAV